MTAIVTLTGLPGTGKTQLGLALAAAWSAHAPWLLLHTDLLKVTLRHTGLPLEGPTWRTPELCERARPAILAQIAKARRDGYGLLIEGTLAVGLPADRVFLLSVDEATRLERVRRKHTSAADALREADLTAYHAFLREHTPPAAIRLDARRPIPELVTSISIPR